MLSAHEMQQAANDAESATHVLSVSDVQEALKGAESAGHVLSVGSAAVYVGCMWGSEYLDVLSAAGAFLLSLSMPDES